MKRHERTFLTKGKVCKGKRSKVSTASLGYLAKHWVDSAPRHGFSGNKVLQKTACEHIGLSLALLRFQCCIPFPCFLSHENFPISVTRGQTLGSHVLKIKPYKIKLYKKKPPDCICLQTFGGFCHP